MLKNKTALITGAGRGIGATIATRFASEGATVIVADIASDPAQEVADSINSNGGKAEAACLDVTNKDQVAELISNLVKRYDRLDILINNAGITRDSLAMRMSEEAWDQVITVNLKGTWIPSQAVIRPMRKRKWGRIVNTASIAALGNVGQANYSASKGGVISLTRTLALELARSGITVNCIAPGAIMTPMLEEISEDMRKQYLERIPVRRFGTPNDVASAHLFFCSDLAEYITGQVLFVDGGLGVGM
ncbi:MAG: 3-oxoacyl-[acyl-carrier-protein] reductase [Candidatus Hatepunaea meridiana]|nr:3-oxoacyl-[acyl-carrier-protein] reductase [Candidatus Hatepunaea meridiana]